jgi:hypothetical protein
MRGMLNMKPRMWEQASSFKFAAVLSAGLFAVSGCSGGGSSGDPGTPASKLAIQPMTNVVPSAGTGYFSDPYPIQTATPPSASAVPSFSGTTRQTLTCSGALAPDCFTAAPNTIDAGGLAQQAAAAGTSIKGFENLNVYQDSSGAWQMAVTAQIAGPSTSPADKATWHVIMHARPASSAAGMPTAWVADALLVGSLSTWAAGNYDGKYFEDSGTLYLVYSMNLPDQSNGIAAQAMQSATQAASSAPVPLLGPETANGGYNSELFYGLNQPKTYKQIETGNVSKVQGKYVIAYSAGGYDQSDYKAGVAWSDTFLPSSGAYYKRAQKIDTAGAWGQPNHAEVQYLLQSQVAQWPNYVAGQVLAPGVPSIVSDTAGHTVLYFAGYAPSDAPVTSAGNYIGSYRRPFYVGLQVRIPSGATVAATAPQDLAAWLTPATGP